MNEVDEMLDVLTERVYVLVWRSCYEELIIKTSERMTLEDANREWYFNKRSTQFDLYVAHYKDITASLRKDPRTLDYLPK